MASTHSQQIVQKLWNYCNLLREHGCCYGDTSPFRVAHKAADERTKQLYAQKLLAPVRI